MSKNHLSKKELQSNELEEALLGAKDFVESHRRESVRWVAIGIGVLAVAGAVWGGISYRKSQLAGRLSEALAVLEAPLAAENLPPSAGIKMYKDEAERTAEAKRRLEALAKDSPSSTPGRIAAGLVLGIEGKKDPSTAGLDALRDLADDQAGSVAAGMAAVSLVRAKAAGGHVKEAIDLARKYLESPRSPLPKDVLIFTLAELYEKNGQSSEAKSYFRRILDEFPDSPMRGDAQQRVSTL